MLFSLSSRLRTALPLAFLFASIQSAIPMRAQSALSAPVQSASGADDTNQMLGGVTLSGSGAGFNAAPPDSGRTGRQIDGSSTGSALWNHLLLDAFQLGRCSGNSCGAAGSGRSFNGGGQSSGSGAAPQMGGGPGFNGDGPGGNSASLDSLFRMASDLSRDLGAGRKGNLGTALGVLPTLNQLTRGGLNLPFNSSLGNFRLSCQNLFGGTGSPMGSRISYGSPSASFTSTHLKTGKIDFSSSATVSGGFGMSAGMSSFGGQGGGSTSFGARAGGGSGMGGQAGGGAPGGGPGSHGGGPGRESGGGGRPSASVSLRLNF